MEFQVLGPLEVRDGARVLPVGRGKPSALLALLLLHANEVVSTDRLIDELWGERPPATAPKALQVYVAKLRQALGAELIVTRAPGYELRLADEGELDVRRFERGLATAREALAAGDARRASALLSEALALWRGPPLADLAYERFAQPEVLRLDELRLAALEERIEADLALGRHADVVGELERLVAQHPLRERPRAQLMLALYRCGRQAEALDSYQAARRALVEELGIEPGAALRELQQALLAQDPALGSVATPAPVELPPAEERKLVSVLALDCEPAPAVAREPERLRRLLDELAEAVGAEVAAAGGRVEPETPGAVLATFGAVVAQEDHAQRAVSAARAAVSELTRRFGDEIAVRAGVESGEVMVGAGIEGAAPGAARRLAARAAPGDVVLGERAAAGVAALSPRSASFVGRAAELDLLRLTFERVANQGRPHLVAVVGDAGVGKSRFVRELREQLAPAGAWHVGRCPAYGRATTYRPVAEILRAHAGAGGSDPAEAVRERLGGRALLGLALGLESPAGLHPWEARERLGEEWVDLLGELAAAGPAVIVVEDLHWAEDALLELLDLGARRATGPLLLLVTARPELLDSNPGWGAGHNASRLWLEPLAGAEAADLLDALAPELPRDSRRLVLERAEGNPFFLEEALAWVLEHSGVEGPPDSVQAVIAARVDLLPAPDKQALQAAAVAGRVFWAGAVQALTGSAAGLGLLEERDFVRRRAGSSLAAEREYAFKHALTREVAYASLPLGRRARLHAAFADWLESTGSGRDEHAPLLAHHLALAAAPAVRDLAWASDEAEGEAVRIRAVQWLQRAAELAIGRYELEPGLALLQEALALEPDGTRRGELWRAVAWGRRMQMDTDGFREAAETALASDPPAAVATEILAELAYAGAQPWVWRESPAREEVEAWVDRVLAGAPPGSRARGLALTARTLTSQGAEPGVADEAVAIAESVGDPFLLARAYMARIDAARVNSELGEAVRWVERSFALADRVADPHHREGLLFSSNFTYLRAGRVAAARALSSEHRGLADRLAPHQRVHAITGSVMPELAAGDWAALAALAGPVEAAATANRDTPCQFNWRSLLMTALGRAQLGDLEEAERLERLAEELHDVGGAAAKEPALLRLALVRGDLATAERLLREAPGADAWWDFDYAAARLDAMAVLGDRAGIEREAAPALALGGYTEPFALRALGLAREEPELLGRAAQRFAAIGAVGHASWAHQPPPSAAGGGGSSRTTAST
jgi:DNA-binding SARP family transcriptional activator